MKKNEVIKLSGTDVLDMRIDSLDKAEVCLAQSEHLDKVSFWLKGKAYKAIRDGIDEGMPGFKKYNSFTEYCNSIPDGMAQGSASRLILAFEQVEQMSADGVPVEELPTSEHDCRVLRYGKEQRDRTGYISPMKA